MPAQMLIICIALINIDHCTGGLIYNEFGFYSQRNSALAINHLFFVGTEYIYVLHYVSF